MSNNTYQKNLGLSFIDNKKRNRKFAYIERFSTDATSPVQEQCLSPKSSTNAIELCKLGLQCYQRKELNVAIAYLDQAIKVEPNYIKAYVLESLIHTQLGDYQAVIEDCTQLLSLSPRFAFAYASRGFAYSSLGDFTEAIADYNQAINLDPDNHKVYANRGFVRSVLGDYFGAISDFHQALQATPKPASVQPNRGSNLYSLGTCLSTTEDLKQPSQTETNGRETAVKNNLLKSIRGRKKGSVQYYTNLLKMNPKLSTIYLNRGNAYQELEDYQKAIEDYSHALQLNPQLVDAYISLGNLFAQLSDKHKAIYNYSQALQLDPDNTAIYFKRADSYYEVGNYRGMIEDYIWAFLLKGYLPKQTVTEFFATSSFSLETAVA